LAAALVGFFPSPAGAEDGNEGLADANAGDQVADVIVDPSVGYGGLLEEYGVDPRLADMIAPEARELFGERFVDLWVAEDRKGFVLGLTDIIGRNNSTRYLYFYKSLGSGTFAAKVQIGNGW
jgi:hypothetical protein